MYIFFSYRSVVCTCNYFFVVLILKTVCACIDKYKQTIAVYKQVKLK